MNQKFSDRPRVQTPPKNDHLKPNYNKTRITVILPIDNKRDALTNILAEFKKLPFGNIEVLGIIHECPDSLRHIAKDFKMKITFYSNQDGLDRVLEVIKPFDSGVFLFTAADIVTKAGDLLPFIKAIINGVDIALNSGSELSNQNLMTQPVNISKYFLNIMLDKGHLGLSSLTIPPYALSPKALRTIGAELPARPSLALAKAVLGGLRVEAVHFLALDDLNQKAFFGIKGMKTTEQIEEEHLEAIRYVLEMRGDRAGYLDQFRNRVLLKEESLKFGVKENPVIPSSSSDHLH